MKQLNNSNERLAKEQKTREDIEKKMKDKED
jgi:hypothetical protein